MPFKFNPFSGNFDQTGSGGGGGSSYIDGEVATYNDLPLDGTAPLNSAWLVRGNSGIWPFNKPAGIYYRSATGGTSRDADYTFGGTLGDVFSDSVFLLYDEASTTRTGQFNLGNITAGQNRVLTWPDGNGTIARTEDFAAPPAIGSTTRNTGAFTTLSANNGTVTTSTPALTVAQTINSVGTTFRLVDLSFTSTASSTNSEYISCSTGGVGNFSVRRDGTVLATTYLSSNGFRAIGGGNGGGQVILSSNGAFIFNDSTTSTFGTQDLFLRRDAAGVLSQHNLANPQTFRIYNTTDAGLTNFERGFMRWSSNVLQIGTEAAGTGSARALELQTGGTTRAGITSDILWVNSSTFGNTGMQINPAANRGGIFVFEAHVQVNSGQVQIRGGAASTDFIRMQSGRLMFSGTDNTFPALKRSSTTLQVRLADDSAFADFECGGSTFNSLMIIRNSSLLMLNGGSIRLQTSAGADTAEIARDAAGIVALRSGTTAHSFRVYNTSTSSNANFERANFRWAANEFIIDAEAGGTGTSLRGIKIGSATSSLLGFYGATPVDRPATVADPTGGGTIDAEARTAINDIIDRLQELGLIA